MKGKTTLTLGDIMIIDYTKIFKNSDELADFCILDVTEQDAIIKRLVDEQQDIGLEYSCTITLKN